MFAPFEKEYGTPMELWSTTILQQANLMYRNSAMRYVELALQATNHNKIVDYVVTAIRFEKQANMARQLLTEKGIAE